jgi:methylglutamate dehydrogenase subunit D
MLDAASPLGHETAHEGKGLRIAEAPGFELTQIAGEEKDLKKAFGKVPGFGNAVEQDGRTIIRVAPSQVWVLGPVPDAKGCYVTPLSSGRSRFLLEGEGVRGVLASCAAIDFSPEAFAGGRYAMTGIHHTPVLIHCVSDARFHIYVLRSFALSVFEWLCDAAAGPEER